jgi:hypothetical protein
MILIVSESITSPLEVLDQLHLALVLEVGLMVEWSFQDEWLQSLPAILIVSGAHLVLKFLVGM